MTKNNWVICHCKHIFIILLVMPLISMAADTPLLRHFIEQAQTAKNDTAASPIINRADITSLYTNNQFQPLWFPPGSLAGKRKLLIQEIESSANHGFDISRYHYHALQAQTLPIEIQDVLLSDALLLQIHDRSKGVVDRSSLNYEQDDWKFASTEIKPLSIVYELLENAKQMRKTLQQLWPHHSEYWSLINERTALQKTNSVESTPLSLNRLLKLGHQGNDVEQLQIRLGGPGQYSQLFDEPLENAVKELQRSAGLDADGIVGSSTLAVLNATPASRIDSIDANLERWRWLPRDIPASYVRVNLAAFRLRAIDAEMPVLSMDVIVGKPYRQTPIFTQTLNYMVFNPYWNVPASIARKDKLPLLRKDAKALALSGFEAKLSNVDPFVSVDSFNWQTIKAGEFTLRQKPGEKNALGKIKFMLPNPYSVYLHDTSDKALFNKTERIFSSGCIRLADPRALANWLLQRENNPASAQLDTLFNKQETRTIYLSKPVPVYLVYFTAFVDEDNQVIFRRDIYDRDQAIIRQLKNSQFKPGQSEL
ncbi:MAG: murein L,D-transpeptidase YcbB/YkuD [Gammaproteobacteria bacterium]|jgi:murein L,D-transpeptidase YcbB/YkuD